METSEFIDATGGMKLLVLLHEKPRYISELIKRSINPLGFMSQDALTFCRRELGMSGLRLFKEEMEEGPRPKTFLVITDKGRRVAEKIMDILEILESNGSTTS